MSRRRALRVAADIQLHVVSCPGERLPYREPAYLNICILGQHRRSKPVDSTFPLRINEQFSFQKTYPHCTSLCEVRDELDEEHIHFELVQRVDEFGCEIVVASFEKSGRDFLFPCTRLVPHHGRGNRSFLMDASIHHAGISPKVEFSSRTRVVETATPIFDYLRDISQMDNSHYDDADDDIEVIRDCPMHKGSPACPKHIRFCSPGYSAGGSHTQLQAWHSPGEMRGLVHTGMKPALRRSGKLADDSAKGHNQRKPPFVMKKLNRSVVHYPRHRQTTYLSSPGILDQTGTDYPPAEPRRGRYKSSARWQQRRSQSWSPQRQSGTSPPSSSPAPGRDTGNARVVGDYCPHCVSPHSEEACTVCRLYRQYIGKRYWAHKQPAWEEERNARPRFKSKAKRSPGLVFDSDRAPTGHSMSPVRCDGPLCKTKGHSTPARQTFRFRNASRSPHSLARWPRHPFDVPNAGREYRHKVDPKVCWRSHGNHLCSHHCGCGLPTGESDEPHLCGMHCNCMEGRKTARHEKIKQYGLSNLREDWLNDDSYEQTKRHRQQFNRKMTQLYADLYNKRTKDNGDVQASS